MNSNKKTARIAGFLYLIYMVTTIFADVFGRSKLIVFGDAAATAQILWLLNGYFVSVLWAI